MASPPDLVIRADRVVLPDGIRPAAVQVRAGRIAAVTGYEDTGLGVPGSARQPELIELAAGEVLLPGLVDTHVHCNEPGRTHWEGFRTATLAAVAGGVTTIIDMPLNSVPPVTDPAALEIKRQAAQGQCHTDTGFWAGAVPGNEAARPALYAAGAFGFKCFTVDSGVPEFPPLGDAELTAALRQMAGLGSVLIVHAEDAGRISAAPAACGAGYASFLRSRPAAAETTAIGRVIEMARATGARAHVLHLSAAAALPLLAAAKAEGVAVTAETCPHYLALAAEEIPDGATQFKCCPPIRDRANSDLLWQALAAGVIDCIVSDHSPCPPELKGLSGDDSGPQPAGSGPQPAGSGPQPAGSGPQPAGSGLQRAGCGPLPADFGTAWGGISSLQLGLPVVWTAARKRGHDLTDVIRWMAAAPARLAGLTAKGSIAVGCDADLVAFAPDAHFTVRPDQLRTRHRLTPYAGQELTGVVLRTWLRGVRAGAGSPAGRLLVREDSAS